MTLFSNNSIFKPNTKHIKFYDSKINVINGANSLAFLPLCDIKLDYKQYQRLSVIVPKNTEDFVLSFPMMGIKTNFLVIKPVYPNSKKINNYMKWKFQSSGDPKWSFTTLLAFTATTNNPLPNLVIDNPSDCDIQIEILVSGMENDYLNDPIAFLYLNNLIFTDVRTLDETNSEILTFFNEQNELAGTLDVADVVNVYKVSGLNRIIIDESSTNNIVLDFKTEYDTLQALSAINWLLLDPATRSLPKAADEDAPVVTFTSAVIGTQLNIDLSSYINNTFAKQNFITDAIDNIVDNVDGIMFATPDDVTIFNGLTEINNIVNPGNYTIELNISDIAGNIVQHILTIDAILTDVTPPVITTSINVSGSTLNDLVLADFGGTISPNDVKLESILSVIDDVDGQILLNQVNTQLFDNAMAQISEITAIGSYAVEFNVSDSSGNVATLNLNFNVI